MILYALGSLASALLALNWYLYDEIGMAVIWAVIAGFQALQAYIAVKHQHL